MAIDTPQKRASTVGSYLPATVLQRDVSADEYAFGPGTYVPPQPVGTPELRGLTMRRTGTIYTTRRTGSGLVAHRAKSTLSVSKGAGKYAALPPRPQYTVRRH